MPDIDHPDGQPVNPHVHRERRDVNIRGIVWFGVGLAAFAIVVQLVLWWMFWLLDRRELRQKESTYPLAVEQRKQEGPALPPAPRLEGLDPAEHDVGRLRPGPGQVQAQQEEQSLRFYGWADPEHRFVRIPIDEARRLALKDRNKYLPTRPSKEDKSKKPANDESDRQKAKEESR